MFCLIFVSVLMPRGFRGRQRTGELLLGLGVSSQEVDEDTVSGIPALLLLWFKFVGFVVVLVTNSKVLG